MLDPTSNMYLQRGGVPLNAWEIREEWFYRDGSNLVFVVGGKQLQKAGLADFSAALCELRRPGGPSGTNSISMVSLDTSPTRT
jgi:hypothetical protein